MSEFHAKKRGMRPSGRLIAPLVAAMAVWGLVFTVSADPVQPALAELLKAYDTVPTAEVLLAADTRGALALADAAKSSALSNYARARAVSLMSVFVDETSRDALMNLTRGGSDEIRAMAIYTLARTFGAIHPNEVYRAVSAAAEDASPAVRAKVALGLRWIPERADSARTLLSAMATAESDDAAKRAIDRTQRRLGGLGPAEMMGVAP